MHIKLFFVTWLITSSQYCTSDFLHVRLGKSPASHSFPEFLSLPESPTYPLLPSLIKPIRKCHRQVRLNRDVFAHKKIIPTMVARVLLFSQYEELNPERCVASKCSTISYNSSPFYFEIGFCQTAQAGLEPLLFLPQPLE